MPPASADDVQFFVSYTGKDKVWAEWIAWQLEHHGHQTLIQAWDFKSGGVFPGDMHRALQKSARVLAVLSPAYMESGFCQPEWQAAFAKDPTGEKGILVCVRVVDFKPDGLLAGRTYVDLVGLSASDASALLLARLEKRRAKPAIAPSFPGSAAATAPSFPGTKVPPPASSVLRTSISHKKGAEPLPSGLVTFMFTDIVGSTAMKGKMGGATSAERQDAFLQQIKIPHEKIIRERVLAHRGDVIKSTGDGFLIVFSDAERAVLCAVEIQQKMATAAILTPSGPLQIRIGLHSGQATPVDGDYTSSATDKAARVESKAEPGRVYLSSETYILIRGKVRDISTSSAGEHDMKGVAKEELFVASLNGSTPQAQTAPAVPPLTAPILQTSIPHNLPTLQPFFGREEELKRIADALDPDSRTWGALIEGEGGMGKTSLAVRAAYDVSPVDFKRIIFISLKTRELDDTGVRDLSGFLISGLVELLNELARGLDRDDIVKAPEDQCPRLLLGALRGTQTLLVLDNLESLLKRERDTLFTFVKKLPAGCKAILTSRGRIGSGAEELILEKLSEDAAFATLAELATHNRLLAQTSPAERMALYEQSGGKPLLLRWTAGQLGRGHCLTFTDALHFLRSCPPGNDPLEFIFGDLVEDFEEAETKTLCALTYFTLPASVEHIAALAGLPEPDSDRALRKLTVRSLAVPADGLKTFALVPMVADFLRKKKPEIVAETGDRLEKRAYALIIENGYEKYDRFPALEAAWPGIAPALPLFLAGDNARLQCVCDALTNFLNFQGRWDERLALSEKAEARAVAAADYSNAGWRAYQAGMIHTLRQQADAVLASADRAAAHWTRAKAGARERSTAISLRGLGLRLKKDYPAAIAAYRESLDLRRSLAVESVDVAVILNALANAEMESGEFVAAEEHYREALRAARVVNYAEGMANYTGNLAELTLNREDWRAAEALAREALHLSEGIHRQELIAEDNRRLAHALVRQGKAAEARPHALRAVEIYTRLGSPDLKGAVATLRECEG